jgi:hypothetical protein
VNLRVDLPNAAQFRSKDGSAHDDTTSAQMVVMLSEFAKAVRAQDVSRPIFSGHSPSAPLCLEQHDVEKLEARHAAQAKEIILRDNPAR